MNSGQTELQEVSGELEVTLIEDSVHSETRVVLVDEEHRRTDLVFEGEPNLASGDHVRLLGEWMDDGRFFARQIEFLNDDELDDIANEALTGNTRRLSSKVAVLLVHWGTPDAMTVDEMRNRVFTNTNSTRAWFQENSYGLVDITGDVFGWFSVPPMTACDYGTLATNARAAAQSAGVSLAEYNQVAIYFPQTSQCRWSGLAMVGRPTRPAQASYFNGAANCSVLAHELMHNFGARHSASYTCTGSSVGAASSCTFSEYGDLYDPMGNGCYHTNAYQKSAQGWLGACNLVTVARNGTFDVVPSELASNGVQALRIPMSPTLCPTGLSACYYFLEYRQPLGIFGSRSTTGLPNNGLLLHVGSSVDLAGRGTPAMPFLIDTTPGSRTSSDHRDAMLTVGRTFDDGAGVRITLNALSASAANVSISLPEGSTGTSTCIDGSPAPGAGTPPPVTSPPVTPPPTSCGAGESAFNGHCYALTTSSASLTNARNACAARGAGWSLADVRSAEENGFVASMIANTGEYWLAGSDAASEGRWTWSDGAEFWSGGLGGAASSGAYANFVSGEPNNGYDSDCMRIINGGGWRDGLCSSRYRAVCERN